MKYYDQHVRLPDFTIADLDLLKNRKVPPGLTHKLFDKSDGSYRIVYTGYFRPVLFRLSTLAYSPPPRLELAQKKDKLGHCDSPSLEFAR